ncbi:ribosomal-protein-alanine N-acetyltransferase [Tardibacter chloracetimidivorans]|uniref:Ribosomal-protein-alanine N-acetyltransferase n=1 Tax=Tardibacter chloracetimidivorans TaxID=1921510 RepID=A0A1L3ZTW0_9SPHN|nr:ribosomal protein S18-alanine N-acetyltransferase [Tardibacter chloracetimidivorans]API59074.1 ribosomal-protein-alanine N-acetyltransferase [Tardibacter chloracetimidivorans]
MNHVIRIADWHDVSAVMPVMEDAFDPLYGEAWSETQLSALLLGPGNWMLVLEVEERICGFAVARSVLDEAELMLIAVPQKMRGRGYGRALLDKVIVECRRRNVRRIYLEVRSDNENAVMLYESAGFRPVGRRSGYYRGKDAVLRDATTMVLDLVNDSLR